MSDVKKPNALVYAHLYVAFITFAVAAVMGLYQVLERAELIPVWAELYYVSVSAHGIIMAFVLTTFFMAGFGYYCAAVSLKRKVWASGFAWFGFVMMLTGVLMVVYALLTRQGTVLYTFYPPLTAHWTFYVGAALLVAGSIPWIITMVVMSVQWKNDNPGQPLPLVMFGTTTNAFLWAWTMVGVVLEVVFQLIPLSLGLIDSIDVGLARTLFSWTLHPIVYVWLLPAYVVMYTLVPKIAGGRLISDEMARVAFILLFVFSLPIGMHHLYVDPFQAAGWKLLHAVGTFMVAIPTLLTVFTVLASLEIAGRLRGGTGLFGWLKKIDWNEPAVLGTMFALVMLGFGGFGGMVNASYSMNVMIHNTMWVPAHFHLMFGGGVVIMYFVAAYILWPKMSGKQLFSRAMAVKQLWFWFVGMVVMTFPWHYVGLLWMPRRTAFTPYDPAFTAQWYPEVYIMVVGGVMLLISGLMFVYNLLRTHGNKVLEENTELEFCVPVHAPVNLPKSLNGWALWNWVVLVLMIAGFGYPIAQFWLMDNVYNALPWGW